LPQFEQTTPPAGLEDAAAPETGLPHRVQKRSVPLSGLPQFGQAGSAVGAGLTAESGAAVSPVMGWPQILQYSAESGSVAAHRGHLRVMVCSFL